VTRRSPRGKTHSTDTSANRSSRSPVALANGSPP
jgi:hypothetical protein